MLGTGKLGGQVKSSLKIGTRHLAILQSEQGLTALVFDEPQKTFIRHWRLTEDPASGAYVTTRVINDSIWLAHMHEVLGILSVTQIPVAALDEDKPTMTTEIVDGEADKSYRGLDIAIASFRGQPVLYYLDGWALRLREALRKDGGWTSREIPLDGALGFYTQVLEENDERLTLGCHNFRTNLDKTNRSFEDLMTFQVSPPIGG